MRRKRPGDAADRRRRNRAVPVADRDFRADADARANIDANVDGVAVPDRRIRADPDARVDDSAASDRVAGSHSAHAVPDA